ncbi:MAG TPA: 2Fe-2S iron-sulfur cluster-binding protein, partial [Elusimicrobiales bacterium]|nr:2Fe-2S iron-sulfur cluster-binding protein [Elusimicrobiales bacterium]
GYCIPGIIMSATALMEAEKDITDEVAREYMDGNLCRCTGYEKIWTALRRTIANRAAATPAKKTSAKGGKK